MGCFNTAKILNAMQLFHFYFLIQTQIEGRTAYLVNTERSYIMNVLTQIKSREVSEKAVHFINNIIPLQDEPLEYIFSASQIKPQLVVIHVNLGAARASKIKGCNWVGQDYFETLILNSKGYEREIILSQLNAGHTENNPNLSH